MTRRRFRAPALLGSLLLALLLAAAPAGARELKVSTWNLEWLTLRPAGDPALPADVLPKTEADLLRLRRYALALDADIVAFQEVDGEQAAARVFPPDRYALVLAHDRVVQQVGFAIRRGLAFTRNPDLTALDPEPAAPFPLRSGIDVTLGAEAGGLRLLGVHLKSGCHSDRLGPRSRACDLLARQVAPLQSWMRARAAEGTPFLMLGDFNRVMDGRDELLAALRAAAPLDRATEGLATPCWGGNSFIDHLLAGGPARGWVRRGSLSVMVYRETDPAAREHLSDHCPVSVRLAVPDPGG